jgi:hypothetical protein
VPSSSTTTSAGPFIAPATASNQSTAQFQVSADVRPPELRPRPSEVLPQVEQQVPGTAVALGRGHRGAPPWARADHGMTDSGTAALPTPPTHTVRPPAGDRTGASPGPLGPVGTGTEASKGDR